MRSETPSRRRVVVEVEPAPFAAYVSDRDEWFDEVDVSTGRQRAYLRSCTLDAVATRLGVSRQRVEQIEEVALEKIKIAFELEARLGNRKATATLARLRGAPLESFRAALFALKPGAGKIAAPGAARGKELG